MADASDGLAISQREKERKREKKEGMESSRVVFTRTHARMRKSERHKSGFFYRGCCGDSRIYVRASATSRMRRNANVPMRYRSAGLPPSLICLDGGVTVERETTTIAST